MSFSLIRNLRPVLIAAVGVLLPLAILAISVSQLVSHERAEAVQGVSDPVPDAISQVAIDTITTGNTMAPPKTGLTQSVLDSCISVAPNAVFTWDIVIDEVSPLGTDPNLSGGQVDVVVPAGFTVTAYSQPGGVIDFSYPAIGGGYAGPTTFISAWFDLGSPYNGEIVFGRYSTTASATPGVYTISLGNEIFLAGDGMGDAPVSALVNGYVFVGQPVEYCVDDDNDAVIDILDNCRGFSNPGQENTDGDADGDACDPDDDNDGVLDGSDDCPATPTGQPADFNGCPAAQVDEDLDGVCDPDKTSSLHCVGSDTCPNTPVGQTADSNGCGPSQVDQDLDGVCDPGKTSNLHCVGSDACPDTSVGQTADSNGCAAAQVDQDLDGVCDPGKTSSLHCIGSDNCPTVPNTDQTNTDTNVNPPGDGLGDACDPDDDDDGASDATETGSAGIPPGNLIGSDPLNPASTPELCDTVDNDLNEGNNEGYTNTDGDALEDCIDPDDDNDQFPDIVDNCDTVVNISQMDINGDGEGDACDDTDGDDVMDDADNCLVAWNSDQNNSDADSLGDACDADDDNDTVIDIFDNCSVVPNPGQADIDGDGEGDACDDSDGDGVVDETDNCLLVPNPDQLNADGDSLGNACEPDDDADGIFDGIDGTWDGFTFTDESQTFSNFFTDQHLGGVTYGEVLDRGTIYVQISELPNPTGVLIWGVGSGSPATVRQICDLTDVTVNGGAAVSVSCTSSVVLNVITGSVTTRSGNLTVHIPTGASAVIEESASGYSVSVPADSPGGVSVNGTTLAPGTADVDQDNDGFLASVEAIIGTSPNLGCGSNAWPADFNDDHVVSITDILTLKGIYGTSVPPTPARYDVQPSGSINISDVLLMKFVFGSHCTP